MTRIYRAVVRGQFADLTEQARATLVERADEHDIFRSAFTPEGTLTYDERLRFFNIRFELRIADPDGPHAAAAERARSQAEDLLGAAGYGHRDLKVTLTDMASVWD
ncbi:MAG: hypothetical protein JWM47_3994 [Acidimicrobiales bacterium]|nr:hypothetical protein [Acidimicrobiales bacterium]